MKRPFLSIILLLFLIACEHASEEKQNNDSVVTTDIDLFWKAYDEIVKTKDSLQQFHLLDSLFLNQGTPGLDSIRVARRYSPQDYINAINNYPKFWESIRPNMQKAKALSAELEQGTNKLREIYPDLKPAKIYFTVGAFRTNGTTMDSLVLIGSELAMADENTVADEFSGRLGHLPAFFKSKPRENIVFLNTHEFVHTQQITTIGHNLLAQSLYEGVAEFVAEKALGQASPNACIAYGKANDKAVKTQFQEQMFSGFIYNWIMNNTDNRFKTRDLGYYIGYAIAQKHYDKTADKQLAIKQLIELNYTNETEVEAFVDSTGYFDISMKEAKQVYETNRPVVIAIEEFENGAQDVDPNTKTVTLVFSEPMDVNSRGFELGPLGVENVLRAENVIGFSEDGKTFKYETTLSPNKIHQVEVSNNFRSAKGIDLVPYLIEIKTSN